MNETRVTIGDVGGLVGDPTTHMRVSDKGARRYRAWLQDFDTRANLLQIEIGDNWDESTKNTMRDNQKKVVAGLVHEFGAANSTEKIDRFVEIKAKPLSVISYHNEFFAQSRVSYVMGAYYPALTSACALAERILNHLVIDLREDFRGSDSYKKVYRKQSFDNWNVAIDALKEWAVLLPEVLTNFVKLKKIRDQSIHFNLDTYRTSKADALGAILLLREIIDLQFGTFGRQPWYIPDGKGCCFVKKSAESLPFVRRFLLPKFPFVGIRHSMDFPAGMSDVRFFDLADYGERVLSDEEFREEFEARDPATLVGPRTEGVPVVS